MEYEERKLYFLTFLNQIMETCKCKNFLQNASFALSAAESWWKMIKEALLACSNKGTITLSLDGKMVKGVVGIDNISGIYSKDTAKEITIRVIANEVKVKLPNGEIKDISEM